ncbi:hypothetical protein TIFTF001_011867 [Ficus carica]|uniref:Uncharacterized protein n=1 Tax=Ficus carica TaxID=3494 RepID=A0AA88A1C3_FICCA|nr:hypothetical protein TIFTF001_011867 [Ficus carica]
MKLLASAGFLVFIIIVGQTNVVQASSRISFIPRDLEPSDYVTITGCNNDCDTACCSCDIKKEPPLCVECCLDEP